MKSVSVRLLEGDYKIVKEGTFLGDLEFGDFDSAELDFIPNKKSLDINLKISYTKGGERIELIKAIPYDYQVKSKTSTYLAVLLLVAVGVVDFCQLILKSGLKSEGFKNRITIENSVELLSS